MIDAPIMIEKKVMKTRFLRTLSDLNRIRMNMAVCVVSGRLSPAMEHLRGVEFSYQPGRHERAGKRDQHRNGDVYRDDNRAERYGGTEDGEPDYLGEPGPGDTSQKTPDYADHG